MRKPPNWKKTKSGKLVEWTGIYDERGVPIYHGDIVRRTLYCIGGSKSTDKKVYVAAFTKPHGLQFREDINSDWGYNLYDGEQPGAVTDYANCKYGQQIIGNVFDRENIANSTHICRNRCQVCGKMVKRGEYKRRKMKATKSANNRRCRAKPFHCKPDALVGAAGRALAGPRRGPERLPSNSAERDTSERRNK